MAIDPILTESYFKPVTNAATGRVAFEIQAGAGKTTVEAGDTGWRDLSGSLHALVTSGRILVRRQAGLVTWNFIGVTLAAGASTAQSLLSAVTSQMEPFLPDFVTYESVQTNATITGRFSALVSGSPRLDYATVGAAYSGTISFPVRGSGAWPTALPGVANGQPVSV